MKRINKQRVYNFYNRKNKWLGLIDYKTLLIFIIYVFIILKLVSSFKIDIIYKSYIVINLILPILIFIIVNINEESIIDKLFNILNYIVNKKIFLNIRYYAKLETIYRKNVKK